MAWSPATAQALPVYDSCLCSQLANKLNNAVEVLGTAAAASLCASEHKRGGHKVRHRAQRSHKACAAHQGLVQAPGSLLGS